MKKSECLEPKTVRTDGGRVVRMDAAKPRITKGEVRAGQQQHTLERTPGPRVRLAEEAAARAEKHTQSGDHARAAEAHKEAALHYNAAATTAATNGKFGLGTKLNTKFREHQGKMKESVAAHEAAGGEWDEDKHSRDENGKFA